MVSSSQLAGGRYFSCSICVCGWLLLLCDWLSCWQFFWPGHTIWHYFSSRHLMGWLSCFVLPDSIFQYSLFFSLRQSRLCGCLLMMFAQLWAFPSLYIAVKGTVVCRYVCIHAVLFMVMCLSLLVYELISVCAHVHAWSYTLLTLWVYLYLCAYNSIGMPVCIVCVYLTMCICRYEWICILLCTLIVKNTRKKKFYSSYYKKLKILVTPERQIELFCFRSSEVLKITQESMWKAMA